MGSFERVHVSERLEILESPQRGGGGEVGKGGSGSFGFVGGGGVHAWNGYHLSFWRFSPCFTVSFSSKLAIVPLKRSVLWAWKGHFRARKGQMVDLGFRDPKTTWNAYKTRENVTTPQLASLHGVPPNWAKKCYKTGETMPKGQLVPISRAHV